MKRHQMCTKEIKLKITQRNMTYAVFWKGPNAKKRRLKKLCTVKKRQRWTTYWQYRWMAWFWTRNLFKSTNIRLFWLMLFFSRAAHQQHLFTNKIGHISFCCCCFCIFISCMHETLCETVPDNWCHYLYNVCSDIQCIQRNRII